MPPRPAPKKQLKELRDRFRQIVDWGFDGDLSLASRVLEMPFSTVQQYYQKGPRRISPAAVKRIDKVLGVGQWLIGMGDYPTAEPPESVGEAAPMHIVGGRYWIPHVVTWRLTRVVQGLSQLADMPQEELERVVLSPIFAALESGLLKPLLGAPDHLPALPGGTIRGRAADVARDFGMTVDRARAIHHLCRYWETAYGLRPS